MGATDAKASIARSIATALGVLAGLGGAAAPAEARWAFATDIAVNDVQVCRTGMSFQLAAPEFDPATRTVPGLLGATPPPPFDEALGGFRPPTEDETIAPRRDVALSGRPIDFLVQPDDGGQPEPHSRPTSAVHALEWNRELEPAEPVAVQFFAPDQQQVAQLAYPVGSCHLIDVRPGRFPNTLDPDSRDARVSVAVLTTPAFDARRVQKESVRLGALGTEARARDTKRRDADDDGDSDLVIRFRTRDAAIPCGANSIRLTGRLSSGAVLRGSDAITTVDCAR